MQDVKAKWIAMVRSGITPKAIEACRDKKELEALAELNGWDHKEVREFGREIDAISFGRSKKEAA